MKFPVQPPRVFPLNRPRGSLLRQNGLVLPLPHRLAATAPRDPAVPGLCPRQEELEPEQSRRQVDSSAVQEQSYMKGGIFDAWFGEILRSPHQQWAGKRKFAT